MLHSLGQLSIPTLGHFISRPRRGTLDREYGFLEMVCSLIYQVSRVLPEHFECRIEMSAKIAPLRMVTADTTIGAAHALAAAVDLLETMLAMSPPLLFCVVDGLHLLERSSNSSEMQSALRRFVDCVCEAGALGSTEKTRIFKVLLTTDGHSKELRWAAKRGLLTHVTHKDEEEDHDESMDFGEREVKFS